MVRARRSLVGGVLTALVVLGMAPATSAAECRAPLEPWTEIDLYFGRNISSGGIVSEKQFRQFLAEVVTPRFPDGLSVLDVAGQFRGSNGVIVREPSKLLVLRAGACQLHLSILGSTQSHPQALVLAGPGSGS